MDWIECMRRVLPKERMFLYYSGSVFQYKGGIDDGYN